MTPGVPPLVQARSVLSLLLALTVARGLANVWLDPLPLSGDEAQYWIYGEHLAGGYYSKPPLLPWLIRASTELFGDSAWAIRLPSLLLHPLIAVGLYALGRVLFDRVVGLVAALIYLTLPAVTVSSMLASTDPPMMLGWAFATLALVIALRGGQASAWLLTGAAVGLGFLGKYTMVAWLGGAGLVLLLDPHWRRGVSWRGLGLALVAAVVMLSPNLIWNARAGFPTLRHLGENANVPAGGDAALAERAAELGDFLVSQIGVFGPITFGILVVMLFTPGTWRSPALRLLLGLGLPLLLIIAAQAWLNRANANWAAPAYLGFSVAVAAWLVAGGRRWLLRTSVAVHLAAFVVAVAAASLNAAEPSAYSRSVDPFKRLRGIDRIAAEVQPVLEAEPDAWLVVSDRMLLSSLLHGTGWPLERSATFDWDQRVNNHFDMVTAFPGDPDAVFVIVETHEDLRFITMRFREVETVIDTRLRTHDDRSIPFRVLFARGFQGYG
ncbi:MAG: glycosyltransferase family 39 protein [Pseudomonadota bacterium]